MAWHEANEEFNGFIKQLFHDENWQERAEAARQLGLLKDGRATNLMCRALRKEQDEMVCNKIIEALGRIGDAKATMIIIEKLRQVIEKSDIDKFSLIYIIEGLINLKDKRALIYIGTFLNSEDDELRSLTKKAFDTIEPNWREIIKKELKKNQAINDIFKNK